jgi:alpha-galactosidase
MKPLSAAPLRGTVETHKGNGARRGRWALLAGKALTMLCCLVASGFARPALASITYDGPTRVFRIDAAGVSYAFGINERGELQALYWGARLGASDPLSAAHSVRDWSGQDVSTNVTPQEFAGWGGGLVLEPGLKITFPDGNRDLVLHYVSHHIDGSVLTVTLKDISRDVFVDLRYEIDEASGILARSAESANKTKEGLTIESAAAASWTLPRGTDYSLYYLTGRWSSEDALQRETLTPTARVLESRRGSSSAQTNPWFAIERGPTDEQNTGSVWFGALGWSGSWRITVEQDVDQQVRVTGGFNPFDFGYHLAPGESLKTPIFYGGYSHEGVGGASRLLHRYEITKILPEKPNPRPRPVDYDSWEATFFKVDEAGQSALAEKAAALGVERFTMDDGWFGARNDDHAGLGDWTVNPRKFPNGLKPLIDKVHSLGMDFGIWVEPEMVNPNSDLYRAHPDWVLNFTGRPRSEGRNQLVLNLARQDVRDYVFGFLDKLLNENDIAFFKWDYNRVWSEPGWPAVAPEDQKQVYVKYIENLYSILAELRAKHPRLEIEDCSSGGGRVDLGILRYTDQVWTSDNSDPFDRLTIQDGFTYAYTPGVMMQRVPDSPGWMNHRTTSMQYRMLSGMQGSLGLGGDLNKWTPEELGTVKTLIAEYKQVRETIQHGSLYRLVSPRGGSEQSVTESVAMDGHEVVVFTFLHSSGFGYPYPRVFLQGLESGAQYRMTPIAGKAVKDTPETATGAYWMSHGFDPELVGDFQAAAFKLERVAVR